MQPDAQRNIPIKFLQATPYADTIFDISKQIHEVQSSCVVAKNFVGPVPNSPSASLDENEVQTLCSDSQNSLHPAAMKFLVVLFIV